MKQENTSLSLNVFFPKLLPDAVFNAWVKSALMEQWLFVGPTSEIVNISLELKPNANFSILEKEKSNGEMIDHFGCYKEIRRPERLAFTLTVPKHFPGESNVAIDFQLTPSGCLMHFRQSGVPKEVVEPAWIMMFVKLKLVLG